MGSQGQYARSYALEAERRMGELLKETERAKGTAGMGRPTKGSTHKEPPKDDTPTLAALGVSKKESARAQMLADIPDENFEQVKTGSLR